MYIYRYYKHCKIHVYAVFASLSLSVPCFRTLDLYTCMFFSSTNSSVWLEDVGVSAASGGGDLDRRRAEGEANKRRERIRGLCLSLPKSPFPLRDEWTGCERLLLCILFTLARSELNATLVSRVLFFPFSAKIFRNNITKRRSVYIIYRLFRSCSPCLLLLALYIYICETEYESFPRSNPLPYIGIQMLEVIKNKRRILLRSPFTFPHLSLGTRESAINEINSQRQ